MIGGRVHRRMAWLVFGSVWLVYFTTAGGSLGTGDAVAMFEVAQSMLDQGRLDVPAAQSTESWRGLGGRYYSPLGIGQSLFDVPFILLGRAISSAARLQLGGPDTIPKATVALASTLPAAAAAAFGFLLAWRLSSSLTAALVAAYVLAFGTLLWPYSKFGFNAALTAGSLTAGVYGLVAGMSAARARWLLAGSAGVGFAILTRHELLLAGAACLPWLWWQLPAKGARGRLFGAGAAGIVGGAAIWLTLNAVRFGNPLTTGHAPVLSFDGLTAYLTSPAAALWLYAPPAVACLALLPAVRRRDPLAPLLAAIIAIMLAFYASLDDWLGTRSYGPRYLVPLLPLMVAPLACLFVRAYTPARRWALVALCAAGVAVQLPAVVVDFSRVGIAARQPAQSIRRDDWRWAPVRLNAVAAARAVPANIQYLLGGSPVPNTADATTTSLADRVPFSLDFWWLYLFYLGILPRFGAIAAAMLPVAAALALARIAAGLARSDE